MAHFGEIFAELRKDHGLTQCELAQRLKVSMGSISAYERGTRLPNILFLKSAASFFGVSTDYLLGLTSVQSLDAIFSNLGGDDSLESILECLKDLSPQQRQCLLPILEDMRFATRVRNADRSGR